MYLQHFGLNELPFRLVPAPGFFCATGVRRQILDALPALLRSGESLVAIIGDAGTGKTVLSRRLTEQLSDEAVVLELSGASLGSSDLLGALRDAIEESRTSENAQDPPLLSGALPGLLGAVLERAPFTSLLAGVVGRAAELLGSAAQQQSERTEAPTRVLRSISRRVLDLAEEGRRLVVLIDDAHCLCARSLEALQLLADLEPEPPHRVQIVLLGLPELHARLIVPPASSLGQRLTYSFELGTLERVELESYVSGRLAHAGCENPTLFSGCALDAVLEATGGVPRLVNVVCHGSLTQACAGGDDEVQRRHVRLSALEADGATRIAMTAPARLALQQGSYTAARQLTRAGAALWQAGCRALLRIHASLPSRRPVRLALPSLGPKRRFQRVAKWAAVPLAALLVAVPLGRGLLQGPSEEQARMSPQVGERLLADALTSLVEDSPFELPAVSKRSPLAEDSPTEPPAARPAPTSRKSTPESVNPLGPRSRPARLVEQRTAAPVAAAPSPGSERARRSRAESKPPRTPSRQAKSPRSARSRKGRFGKTRHMPEAGEVEDQAYGRALRLARNGNEVAAEEALGQLLERDPDHHRAREARAGLLIRLGRVDEAVGELETGMVLAPTRPGFAKLRARILSQRGTPAEALEILGRAPPPLPKDPEYHALIAALHQRMGEHGLAADLYRRVLGAQPQNAAWWMGFGISLEGEDAAGSALLAYRAAAALAGLGPESRRYVESRITALGAGGR